MAPLIWPTLTTRSRRSRRSWLRTTSASQPATLKPKVIGSPWMAWLRPIITVPLCSRARTRRASASLSSSARSSRTEAFICRATPVSSTSELVMPTWM